ncbi:MAG: lycopene cyclase domain-containing protein [Bacteroidia bacterium]|nr:lycopene cyclase domain-containing protein [Bacteroidia bacterium]
MEPYTYLLLDVGSLLGPLALSFDRRVAFFRSWKALFPAIAATALLFIVWDVYFTEMGVWGFNPDFLTGPSLLGLPLEECLFFFVVPYACVFVYEVIGSYFPAKENSQWSKSLAIALAIVLFMIGVWKWDHWYTGLTFLGTAALLLFNVFILKPAYLGKFWRGYFVSLIPFLIINGVLTALPVVWYNNDENLGIRITTIPIEDSIYLVWLLLMCVNIFEGLKTRSAKTRAVLSGLK